MYTLDSSHVNYVMARELYDNVRANYKLGAGFAKPIINTAVAFMGVPTFRIDDEDAQTELENFAARNVAKMQETHRNAFRDGDCYVRLSREDRGGLLFPEGAQIIYNVMPADMVENVVRNPLTGQEIEYTLKSQYSWKDSAGASRQCVIQQKISAEQIKTEIVSGDTPEGVEVGEVENPWGFIPIVRFQNEPDSSRVFGRSDLEAVEPYLKAYHDVMMHAIQGSKLHSTPRLKLKLKNVAKFLKENCGITNPAADAENGITVNLSGREILFFQDGDDAEFIEARSSTGDATDLLHLLFYLIVDTSETPEFAFGVHTPSSLSSVREQMPILVRRVARKRECFTEAWQLVARMVLAMTTLANGGKFETYETTLIWDEIDPRDDKDVAETLDKIVGALARAVESQIMSSEAAADFLSQYVETMHDYITDDAELPGERERIVKDMILRRRVEDGELVETEYKAIRAALEAK